MADKPLIMEEYQAVNLAVKVNFEFKNNITMLVTNSALEKMAVFSLMKDSSGEDARLVCINYIDVARGVNDLIKNADNQLVVIDNADLLLSEDMRRHVALDERNQYLLIGRNPQCLEVTDDNFYELVKEERDGKQEYILRKLEKK